MYDKKVRDLDLILGSGLKVKVLRSLMGLQQAVSGRHAGRLASVSSKATDALGELADLGIVNRVESTGQHLYSINRDHYLTVPLEKLFEAEDRKVSQVQSRLGRVLSLLPGVKVGAIFGSVARGTPGTGSDLDVLVIIDASGSAVEVRDALILEGDGLKADYGSRVSPVVIAAEQWRKLMSNHDTFAESARAEAKVFFGSWADVGTREQDR